MSGHLRAQIALGVLALLMLAAPRAAQAVAVPPPPSITLSPDGRTETMRLDVMTFNIEGLPPPARFGRSRDLKEIGRQLRAMRQAGDAPDVVLFQEAFSKTAVGAVRQAGYPQMAFGPTRSQRRQLPAESSRRGHKWRKGELGVRMVGSGLIVASVYPVALHAAEPFSHRACAGMDCLSNKGAMFVRLNLPGAPQDLEIFNTHMNAQRASGVSARRHTPAHSAQVHELSDFMHAQRDPALPVIMGGDFNMRNSQRRFQTFEANQPLELVHQYCLDPRNGCDVRISWDGDAPWMDTEDLQLFKSGDKVSVRPVRVEAMFDGRPGSPALSDHDGFRVTYELSWPVAR